MAARKSSRVKRRYRMKYRVRNQSAKTSPALVRALVAIGLLLFAGANLYSLNRVRKQRDLLADIAEAVVTRTYSEGELQQQEDIEHQWELIISYNRPPRKHELIVFHLLCDLLVIGVIWVVPGLLMSIKRIFSLDSTTVGVEGSPFPPASISRDQQKRVWRLEGPYEIVVSGYTFRTPGRFEFDLASIQKILWQLIAPFELSVAAPLVHDFIYAHNGRLPGGSVAAESDDGEGIRSQMGF